MGDVHGDVNRERGIELFLVIGHRQRARLAERRPVVEADSATQETGDVTILGGEIDPLDLAAEALGGKPSRAANAGADVEYPLIRGQLELG